MPSNTKFPHNPYGLSSSYSRSDVVIDGMKVKFDKVADLVPAELTVKGGQAHSGAQSVVAASFGKPEQSCTIYIIATPKLMDYLRTVENRSGYLDSISGYIASVRNYVENIYQRVNGLNHFKVKLANSLDIADFNPLFDTKVYLTAGSRSDFKNRTYNYCNANVNSFFFGLSSGKDEIEPGSAHSTAYLVAHEALHSYLIRLGVLLFGATFFLSGDSGGHSKNVNGKAINNLNLDGGDVLHSDTFSTEFQKILPTQLHFLKEYPSYITLTHPRFSLPENKRMMQEFLRRQQAIRTDSRSEDDGGKTTSLHLPSLEKAITESKAHIDFTMDPATVPFR